MKFEDHIDFFRKQNQCLTELQLETETDNSLNMLRKVRRLKKELSEKTELLERFTALFETDNAENAFRRAKSLHAHRTAQAVPQWLQVIPAVWHEKEVPAERFSYWLKLCQTHYLVIEEAFEKEAELFPNFDIEYNKEEVRRLFRTSHPKEFIEGCGDFYFSDEADPTEESPVAEMVPVPH